MELNNFVLSLEQPSPPSPVSLYLQALWYDGKGDWEKAHDIIQHVEDSTAAWIHAYLHRKEGDNGNARYWYNRAGKRFPSVSLQEEWEEITSALLH
ncbi:MAG: hypothetical protein KF746_12965 [Chitinophagaceae bacterium]|nr:hypothetical protein [Chitinophagaceae bacterium]